MAKNAEKKTAAKTTAGKKRAARTPADARRLKVTLVKSTIGFDRKQFLIAESLGLRWLNHTIEVADTPEMRGMIHKVRHLVTVTGDK